MAQADAARSPSPGWWRERSRRRGVNRGCDRADPGAVAVSSIRFLDDGVGYTVDQLEAELEQESMPPWCARMVEVFRAVRVLEQVGVRTRRDWPSDRSRGSGRFHGGVDRGRHRSRRTSPVGWILRRDRGHASSVCQLAWPRRREGAGGVDCLVLYGDPDRARGCDRDLCSNCGPGRPRIAPPIAVSGLDSERSKGDAELFAPAPPWRS